jgi:DNA transformation protein
VKPDDGTFAQFVLEQLAGIPGVRARRMFGGAGLYAGEVFFGILHKGRLYFRTTEASRADYERAGMGCFQPNETQVLRRYFEVPAPIMEERDSLVAWAQTAIHGAEKKGV